MSVGQEELLVINDAAGDLNAVVTLLKNSGYVVRVCSRYDACFDDIKRHRPDLVIGKSSVIHSDFQQHTQQIKVEPFLLVLLDDNRSVESTGLAGDMSDFLEFPQEDASVLLQVVNRDIRYLREFRRRQQTEEDLEKLNKTLINNLRTLERDQQSGFRVQQSMMPGTPQSIGNVTFSHKMIPSLILSGDFIDYAELKNHQLLFFMSDVSGHGASSAFVTVFLKSLSRRLQRESERLDLSEPAEILKWFNTELLECELDHHVTMFIGVLDKHKKILQYANAAQFPGAILSDRRDTRFLEIGGLPLGLYENAEYDQYVVDLPEEFTLILFSDGVFEIMSEQTLKAKEEQLLSLVKYGNRSIEALSDHLGLDKLDEVPDDIALLTVVKAV